MVQRKTLIDTTRSRNIEIFLPSFPLALESLDRTLNEHLNSVSADSPLGLEHIVALKRCVRVCVCVCMCVGVARVCVFMMTVCVPVMTFTMYIPEGATKLNFAPSAIL